LIIFTGHVFGQFGLPELWRHAPWFGLPRRRSGGEGIMSNLGRGLTALAALSFFGSAWVWAAGNGPDATVRRAYAVTMRELASQGKVEPPWRPPHRDRLMS
jgi:hypothetical protein